MSGPFLVVGYCKGRIGLVQGCETQKGADWTERVWKSLHPLNTVRTCSLPELLACYDQAQRADVDELARMFALTEVPKP